MSIIQPSPTYYVLAQQSTHPCLIPLQDYYRANEKCCNELGLDSPEAIKLNWPCFKRKGVDDNEIITIFYQSEAWQVCQ